MAVRRFNGSSDWIDCEPGAADITDAWTIAILLRQASGRWVIPYQAHSTSRPIGYGLEIDQAGHLVIFSGRASGYDEIWSSRVHVTPGAWRLVTIAKGAGASHPRFRTYDPIARTVVETETSADLCSNPVSVGAGGRITFGRYGTNYYFNGELAAAAVWNQALAESELDELATAATLSAWASVSSPRALWLFDQASAATPLQDLIGAADERSPANGTSVVAEEPPIPYRGATAAVRASTVWVDHDLLIRDAADWRHTTSAGAL